jgi:hypothetical protein
VRMLATVPISQGYGPLPGPPNAPWDTSSRSVISSYEPFSTRFPSLLMLPRPSKTCCNSLSERRNAVKLALGNAKVNAPQYAPVCNIQRIHHQSRDHVETSLRGDIVQLQAMSPMSKRALLKFSGECALRSTANLEFPIPNEHLPISSPCGGRPRRLPVRLRRTPFFEFGTLWSRSGLFEFANAIPLNWRLNIPTTVWVLRTFDRQFNRMAFVPSKSRDNFNEMFKMHYLVLRNRDFVVRAATKSRHALHSMGHKVPSSDPAVPILSYHTRARALPIRRGSKTLTFQQHVMSDGLPLVKAMPALHITPRSSKHAQPAPVGTSTRRASGFFSHVVTSLR